MTRLIDADALSKKVSSTTLFIKDAEVFQRMINDATTIEPKQHHLGKSADICIIDEPIVDHDREWIIGCIKHDGFIKTDRFDKANQIILEALEKHQLSEKTPTNTPTDLISRADAMGAVQDHFNADGFKGYDDGQKMMDRIKALPSVSAEMKEYVKDGTLTIQARTIKEVTSIDKVVVYADGYEQEYLMPIPSAEPKRGEWVHKPSKSGEWIWWQCSECGAVIFSKSEADRKIHHAYCGVCGAKMGVSE